MGSAADPTKSPDVVIFDRSRFRGPSETASLPNPQIPNQYICFARTVHWKGDGIWAGMGDWHSAHSRRIHATIAGELLIIIR